MTGSATRGNTRQSKVRSRFPDRRTRTVGSHASLTALRPAEPNRSPGRTDHHTRVCQTVAQLTDSIARAPAPQVMPTGTHSLLTEIYPVAKADASYRKSRLAIFAKCRQAVVMFVDQARESPRLECPVGHVGPMTSVIEQNARYVD